MPPCAALECERTGWTLEMIPTDAPCSAAARAARWPASPAPITRTSWCGMRRRRFYARLCREGPAQRPADRVDRHDAAQHAVAVDGHHGAEATQALVAQQRLERVLELGPQAVAAVVARHHRCRRAPPADRVGHALDGLA